MSAPQVSRTLGHQLYSAAKGVPVSPHNTQLCSNRPVTEAGLARPKELPGCMSVLLCRRAGEFQQRVMAVSSLGPVGQGISALCSAHPRAAEPRACQDVVPSSCGLGVSARRGSIGCAQGAGGSKRVPRCGAVCARIPGSNGVRQRGRWFHRTRPWRGAPSAHACCWPGIPRPCASGYAFLEMREGSGAHQHQALASVGPVSSIRVSGAALRTSTTGCAVQSRSSFAE